MFKLSTADNAQLDEVLSKCEFEPLKKEDDMRFKKDCGSSCSGHCGESCQAACKSTCTSLF